MLIVESYVGINGLGFKSGTIGDAIVIFGKPEYERKTRLGNMEYDYGSFILRFCSKTGGLLECTILPGIPVKINEIDVSWDVGFLKKMCGIDGSPKNSYGFIVLGKLGIAITGVHDRDESQAAITVFNRKELEEFLEGAQDFDAAML